MKESHTEPQSHGASLHHEALRGGRKGYRAPKARNSFFVPLCALCDEPVLCGSAPLCEQKEREAFVREAMTWLGTPFRDQGDVKGANGAVDCAMLLVRSAQTAGLIPRDFDPRPYPPQWHLHNREERFLGQIATIIALRGQGAEVQNDAGLPAEALAKEGDVIVYRVGRCFSHGGIIAGLPGYGMEPAPAKTGVLHAYYKTGHVTLSALNDVELAQLADGRPRPFKLFDLWRVAPAG